MAQPLISEHVRFIFLWWDHHDHGILLAFPYFELMTRFQEARSTASTWGDFKNILGPAGCRYVQVFQQCDPHEPADDDLLDDICDDVWILYDGQFPLLQCAEETTSFYRTEFPELQDMDSFMTEYDQEVLVFPKARFVELKDHLETRGHFVTCRKSPFPNNLFAR